MPSKFLSNIQWIILKILSHLIFNIYRTITFHGFLFQENSIIKIRFYDSLITPHFYYITIIDSVCLMLLFLADIHNISIDFFSSRY